MKQILILVGLWISMTASLAWAHPGHFAHSTLQAGLLHPLTGCDHWLVMCAIGLWAARLPAAQGWPLPPLFMGVMLLASMAALWGLHASWAEHIVLLSVLGLGLLLLLSLRLTSLMQRWVVVITASAQGYLHGLELGTDLLPLIGMAMTSSGLLVLGWVAGRLQPQWGRVVSHGLGAVMMVLGVWALFNT